jgi:hypothetical protein
MLVGCGWMQLAGLLLLCASAQGKAAGCGEWGAAGGAALRSARQRWQTPPPPPPHPPTPTQPTRICRLPGHKLLQVGHPSLIETLQKIEK